MDRRQLKTQSKAMLKNHWGKFALYTLLTVILSAVLNASEIHGELYFTESGQTSFQFLSPFWDASAPYKTLFFLAGQLIFAFITFGYTDIFIKTRAGMAANVKNLFQTFTSMPGKIIGATLIQLALQFAFLLIVGLCGMWLGVFGGLVILIISIGYVFLELRFSMVAMILLENPYTTVKDSFIQSYYVMQGYTWRYVVLILSFTGWILLSILTLGIGLLWLIPYMEMTSTNFYYDIKARQLAAQQNKGVTE